MSEVEIAGSTFHISRLPARKQFHIARRLLPVAELLVPLLASRGENEDIPVLSAVGALADTIGKLSDADADYILDHCLEAVRRKSGMGYQAIIVNTPNGSRLLFEDLDDLSIQLQLIWEVIKENLANFSYERFLNSTQEIARTG